MNYLVFNSTCTGSRYRNFEIADEKRTVPKAYRILFKEWFPIQTFLFSSLLYMEIQKMEVKKYNF